MAQSWTTAQKNAIDSRGKSLMVSAAAGSGKTSVMTERIVSLLSENSGVKAQNLAVVSFTKAAAASLQDKLYRALSEKVAADPENRALSRQLMGLSRAQISTIHSFCYALVRRGGSQLGLPAKVRIAEPERIAPLKREAIEEAVEDFLAEGGHTDLCRAFGSARSLAPLSDAVALLFEKATCLPGGVEAYALRLEKLQTELADLQAGKLSLGESLVGAPLIQTAVTLLTKAIESLSAFSEPLGHTQVIGDKYLPFLAERTAVLKSAKSAVERGDPFTCGVILTEAFPSLPTIYKCPPEEQELKEDFSAVWNEVKKELAEFTKAYLLTPLPEMLAETEKSLALTEEFLALATLAQEKFSEKKQKKGLLDFADLENLALKLVAEKKDGVFVKSEFGEQITEEFDAVFVDEYQDSNEIQDLIFRCVTRPDNLFIVGDPKQSIYRFRGAEPEIFSRYKRRLPRYGEESGTMQAIFLSNNFRSARPVIDLVNRIFTVLMDGEDPDSLYRSEDALRCSRTNPDGPASEIVLLQKPEVSGSRSPALDTAREENAEAKYLAQRIREMLPERKPSDIAVICRTATQIARVRNSLTRLGIPCGGGNESLAEEEEFLFMTSLLSALDNPNEDVPLLGALLSPVFRFDPDDLYALRKRAHGSFYSAMERASEDEKVAFCLNFFNRIREKKPHVTLTELIFDLYDELSVSELYGSQRAVREFFLSCAASADSAGDRSLSALVRYAKEKAGSIRSESGTADGVQLVTIHSSKGLEYPVVFVSFLAQTFVTDDERSKLILAPDFPPAFHLPSHDGRAKINTLTRKSAALALHRAMLEEEMRVLYVALTRAVDQSIVTATPTSLSALRKKLLFAQPAPLSHDLTRALIARASSPLYLLLLSLRESPALRQMLETGQDAREGEILFSLTAPSPDTPPPFVSEAKAATAPPRLLSDLSFTYEERELESLPQKLSVSQLLRMGRQEEAGLAPIALPDFDKGQKRPDGARIGSATHLVMQFADFSLLKKSPEKELARLVEKGFLSAEDAALVDLAGIAAFFTTPLYARLAQAQRVSREKRFNVYLPARALLGREGEVLIQGVVDAWFEDEAGVTILDFKTDRVPKDTGEGILRERHGDQLRLYAMAVSEITGKPVKALFLYSFALKKEIAIPLSREQKEIL